jgi:hypothetical protein
MTHRARSLFGIGLLATLLIAPAACGDSDGSGNDNGRAGASAAGSAGSDPQGGSSSAGDAGSTTSGSGGSAPHSAGEAGGSVGGAPSGEGGASGASGKADGGEGGSGVCGAVEKQEALAEAGHVVECMPLDYATNPPSSGPHYPTWADFGQYEFALPRGFWVHNLEHGAVVVTYRCEDGCEEDLAAARAWLTSLKPDAGCDASGPARVLLIPDPKLDVRWAASAWGYTLRAACFDAATFSAFYEAHAGQPPAPEASLCGTGFDFRPDGTETCGAK